MWSFLTLDRRCQCPHSVDHNSHARRSVFNLVSSSKSIFRGVIYWYIGVIVLMPSSANGIIFHAKSLVVHSLLLQYWVTPPIPKKWLFHFLNLYWTTLIWTVWINFKVCHRGIPVTPPFSIRQGISMGHGIVKTTRSAYSHNKRTMWSFDD